MSVLRFALCSSVVGWPIALAVRLARRGGVSAELARPAEPPLEAVATPAPVREARGSAVPGCLPASLLFERSRPR